LCRYSWCCLVPATNRRRDENAEEEHSSLRHLAMSFLSGRWGRTHNSTVSQPRYLRL
jgi:hypothetical protein